MKIIVISLIVFGFIPLCWAADIPPWHVIKNSDRGSKMIKIVEAVWAYEVKLGKRPSNLLVLVSEGLLKEEDLCLKNRDGSLTVPDYYPNPPAKVLSKMVITSVSSEDGSYQIIVRKDLSISGVTNQKSAE